MITIDVDKLRGRLVRLEPLRVEHAPALAIAASEDRATYGFTPVPNGMDGERGASAYVADILKRRDDGELLPYVQVRVADGVVVGTMRTENFRKRRGDTKVFAAEVGGVSLAASAQRTGINREARLLMLTELFEGNGVSRVDFRADARNERSRSAIEGFGARFEGVLRNWQASFVVGEKGQLRDTAIFSITADEWPAVRSQLTDMLMR